jgi:hypothetical protein
MAIINGQLVGEGEQISLQTQTAPVALVLRVVRIGDGEIQLTDGKQVFAVRLETAPAPQLKP